MNACCAGEYSSSPRENFVQPRGEAGEDFRHPDAHALSDHAYDAAGGGEALPPDAALDNAWSAAS